MKLLINNAFRTFTIILLVLIPLVLISLTEEYIRFSVFTIGLMKAVTSIFLFWLFDKYALSEVDTIKELKKGNIAYAIFLLAIALIVSSAIVSF